MTKRTYICNVCRMEFSDDKADDEIIGFKFVLFSTGERTGDLISRNLCINAENHVCKKCLEGMHSLYLSMKGTL